MKKAEKRGLGFGLTSGIITTLGLLVGLAASTSSKSVVLGGIIIIAIADALSDAFGIHISVEAVANSKKEIWHSTYFTFIYKFIFAIIFIIPVLLFNLNTAVIISIILGLLLLTILSYKIAKKTKKKISSAIIEHLLMAIIVVVITHYLGILVNSFF